MIKFTPASSFQLTPRQKDIAELVLQGKSNREIANHFGLKIKTIKDYIRMCKIKTQTKSRAHLIVRLLPYMTSSDISLD